MHRLSLLLIVILAVACAASAQNSGAPPLAPPPGAGVSAPPTGTGPAQQPPLQPAPGNGVTPPQPANTAGGNTTNGTLTNGNNGNNTDGNTGNTGNNSNGNNGNNGSNNNGNVSSFGTGSTSPQGAISPEIHLETAMPGPGVTSSQPGLPAGATNSQSNMGTPSSPTTYSVPVQRNASQPTRNLNADTGRSDAPIQDTNGMIYAGASYTGEPEDNRSLAEVAAQYKRNRATQNARVFTNEDFQRLNARNDANVMGSNQNAALPQGEGDAQQQQQQQQQAAPANGQKRSPFTPKQPK